MVVASVKSWQDFAMSTAVSVLSPVRTQRRMPMALMVLMASGTPSCNRSSTAVRPTKSKPFSNFAPTSAIFSSLVSSMTFFAMVYSALHDSNSSLPIVRMPTMSVRRPCLEKAAKSAEQGTLNFSVSKPSMTLSAPLVMQNTWFLCFTMTDMRLRSEEKASSCNTMNFLSLLAGPSSVISEVPVAFRVRLQNRTPASCATWTSATSSGDMPWNLTTLFSSDSSSEMCTEWQTARHVKSFRTCPVNGSS
mmetsp:Transcript_146940/g.471729  ORF Transcript_146940/g.471729 Transcript_146940/m.471729 type:complete len:248 (+) Transcript_146940:1329-2072(+)